MEAVDTAAPPEVLALPSWVRRVIALAAIVIGWGFIAWHNHFYVTPAVVILAIGWGASISTLYLMWRVGAAGAVPAQARESWWLEADQREDLEREKRTLLKTIREIEFDQQTGKLSERDAQEMSQAVKIRAIEVMKALDADEEGGDSAESPVRAQIEREVRARLAVEKARKVGASKKAKGKEPAKAGKAVAKADAKSDAKSEAKADAKADTKDDAKARSATAINAGGAADASEAAPLSAEDAPAADDAADDAQASAVRDPDESAESTDKAADGDDIATLATSDAEAAPSGSKSSEVSA